MTFSGVLTPPGRRAHALLPIALAAIAAVCGEPQAHASSLTIDATFNTSGQTALTTADQLAIDAAITNVEDAVASPNNITVSIYFTGMSSGLGESTTSIYDPSYYSYYNAFESVATSPVQLDALASLGTAPTSSSSGNPVNGNTEVAITSAECRNLGITYSFTIGGKTSNCPGYVSVAGGYYDGEISLNTSLAVPPSQLTSTTYSIESVAAHEIDEILGIGGTGSTLTGSGSLTGPVGDLDLFRYANGSRSYSNDASSQPYLSFNGGISVVSYFNQVVGGDFADWQSDPDHTGFGVQVQDAYGSPGTNPTIGGAEITALNMIGYETPEPSTWALLGIGLLGLTLRRLRLSRNRC